MESGDQGQGVPTAVSIQSPVEVKDRLRVGSLPARQCLAEFLAVSVLMLLIQGSSAQAVTSGGTKGNFFTVFLAGSPGVMLATYVSGNVSGAHLNPAFSLPMCLRGHLPWARFLIYSLVQLLSVFCAPGVPYALYDDGLQNYTGGSLTVTGPKEMASIFATYPAPSVSEQWLPGSGSGHLDADGGEGDPGHTEQGSAFRSGACGSGVTDPSHHAIHGCQLWAPNQPAQDLGPWLFAYIAGWGPEVFSAGNGWWWVPAVGPLVGGMLGTATPQLLVAQNHPENSEPSQDLECAQ